MVQEVASIAFSAEGDRLILGRHGKLGPLEWPIDGSTDPTPFFDASLEGRTRTIPFGSRFPVCEGDEVDFVPARRGEAALLNLRSGDGPSSTPAVTPLWRAVFRDGEGWIEDGRSSTIIAYLPVGISSVAVHPSGRLLVIGRESDWQLYRIEGGPEENQV
jgi:hypothetical protein